MADLWNLVFWLLIACAPIYLTIWYFNSEEKEDKIRRERNRIYHLRRNAAGRRERLEPFTSEQRKVVLSQTNGKCFHCCKNLGSEYWEIDHLWPLKLGGVNQIINLVAACKLCNKAKFIANPFSWIITKWFNQGYLNEFELRFLKYYSKNSPIHLTKNKFWESYMNKVPHNITNFILSIEGNLDSKQKKQIYEKYIRIFSDHPEKYEVTDK